MATAYTDIYDINNSNRLYRGYITYLVSYPNDRQARISISYGAQMYEAYLYGAAATLSIDGKQKGSVEGYLSRNPGRRWTTIKNGTYAHIVDRTDKEQTVSLSVRAYGKTVDGYGSAGGSVEKTVKIKIAKRENIYVGQGCPTIDIAESGNIRAKIGTETVIHVNKAAQQGTAPFTKFSIYYLDDSTGKYMHVSDFTDNVFRHDFTKYKPCGGVLEVMIKEHHVEKDNKKEHVTSMSFQVYIDVPKVVLYDGNGNRTVANFIVYDSTGHRKYAPIFVYDKDGKIKQATL